MYIYICKYIIFGTRVYIYILYIWYFFHMETYEVSADSSPVDVQNQSRRVVGNVKVLPGNSLFFFVPLGDKLISIIHNH